MFKHQKKLLHPVKVKKPNPTYAALLQEQLGGPQGEMKAAMQYFAQSLRIQDKEIRIYFSISRRRNYATWKLLPR